MASAWSNSRRDEIARLVPAGVTGKLAAARRLGGDRRPPLGTMQLCEQVFVELAERTQTAAGDAGDHRPQVLLVARESPGRPRRLRRRDDARAIADPFRVAAPVDLVGERPVATRVLLAMSHQAVDGACHEVARDRISVVETDEHRCMHHRERIRLLPFPWSLSIGRARSVPVAREVHVPARVDEQHVISERRDRGHQPLDRDRFTPVQYRRSALLLMPSS